MKTAGGNKEWPPCRSVHTPNRLEALQNLLTSRPEMTFDVETAQVNGISPKVRLAIGESRPVS